MTVIPFPAEHMADCISHCVNAVKTGDIYQTVRRTVSVLQIIEFEMLENGFSREEVERQVAAFLSRAEAAMIQSSHAAEGQCGRIAS